MTFSPKKNGNGSSSSPSFKAQFMRDTLLVKEFDQRGLPSHTLWGNMRMKSTKSRFVEYLKNLNSAERFLKGQAIGLWFRTLPKGVEKAILDRVKEVDPKGWVTLKKKIKLDKKEHAAVERASKEMGVSVKTNQLAVEEPLAEMPGISSIRFIPPEGIKGILAVALAAGYSREEAAAMAQIDVAKLNSLVSKDDVREAQKRMPEAIAVASDQIVMRDLLSGVATESTVRADLISHRRKKLMIDMSAEARDIRKDSIELEKQKEKHIAERFGVERKKGAGADEDHKPE